jgi:hypothetical protein
MRMEGTGGRELQEVQEDSRIGSFKRKTCSGG